MFRRPRLSYGVLYTAVQSALLSPVAILTQALRVCGEPQCVASVRWFAMQHGGQLSVRLYNWSRNEAQTIWLVVLMIVLLQPLNSVLRVFI